MAAKSNTTTITVEGRNLVAKYDVHNARSGEVSAALRTLPDCGALYEQLQQSEVALHEARKRWDSKALASSASRAAEEKLRKQVLTMARAAVSIAEAADVPGLRDVLVADDNDEASIAARLSHDVKAVPLVGHAISSALTTLRQELLATEAEQQKVSAAFDAATRDFGQAFYRAAAVLAQSKAMLFASGIKIADRKVTRKAKKKMAGPQATSPERSTTPTVTPMPLAA